MNSEQRSALSKDLINLQDQYLNVRRSKKNVVGGGGGGYGEVKRSQQQGKIMYRTRYFTLESVFLLVGLTVSLLVLPVVLPPLPPPPVVLLLLPILILAVLMLLALMPSAAARETAAHAYYAL